MNVEQIDHTYNSMDNKKEKNNIDSLLSIAPSEVEKDDFLKQLWELEQWREISIENAIQETKHEINSLFESLQINNIDMKNLPETEKRKINWATVFAEKAEKLWTISNRDKKTWMVSYYKKINKKNG